MQSKNDEIIRDEENGSPIRQDNVPVPERYLSQLLAQCNREEYYSKNNPIKVHELADLPLLEPIDFSKGFPQNFIK
jgi:hypothetical protein